MTVYTKSQCKTIVCKCNILLACVVGTLSITLNNFPFFVSDSMMA
jgi:hypothetical protein